MSPNYQSVRPRIKMWAFSSHTQETNNVSLLLSCSGVRSSFLNRFSSFSYLSKLARRAPCDTQYTESIRQLIPYLWIAYPLTQESDEVSFTDYGPYSWLHLPRESTEVKNTRLLLERCSRGGFPSPRRHPSNSMSILFSYSGVLRWSAVEFGGRCYFSSSDEALGDITYEARGKPQRTAYYYVVVNNKIELGFFNPGL